MADQEDDVLAIDELVEAGRMREQLAIARRIQRGFLPEAPPGLHGFQIEGWNQPCHEAGGDYYDFLRLPGGRLAVAIGDVSSHGIGPALLMASARSALRALLQVEDGPGNCLTRLNDVLAADMLDDHFMTMFAGVLDLGTKMLRYAVAGHERPLRLPCDGDEFERLDARGMPLGIHGGLRYSEGEPVLLRPGDLVAFLTDGMWEATNADSEEFGYERLKESIRRTRDRPAGAILEAVQADVSAFIGDARQYDDLTLMILKVL
ncbi:MAG: PP2C family protein-serine/threonine phosphatase [Planctomycetota bacterium]